MSVEVTITISDEDAATLLAGPSYTEAGQRENVFMAFRLAGEITRALSAARSEPELHIGSRVQAVTGGPHGTVVAMEPTGNVPVGTCVVRWDGNGPRPQAVEFIAMLEVLS